MTGKITEERLAEIAAEYGEMAGNLTGALQDGPGAASTFYMSCSLGEIAGMAREIQSLRSAQASQAGEVEVVAWNVSFPGLPAAPTDSAAIAADALGQGGVVEPLITLASHQSVIADKDAEIDEARHIVRQIYWMAVRYADGRKSYAPGMCNDALRKAYDAGWLTYSDGRQHDLDPQYAREGDKPEYRSVEARADTAEARANAAVELLKKSADAMERAMSWFEAEFSDTDFDSNGAVASIDADLHVAAYDVRAFLSTLNGGKAMTTDQKAIEAAMVWFARNFNGTPAGRELCTGIIEACLAALPASDHATYPRLQTVRAHKHTCASVQPGSTFDDKCDCGALDTAGNAIEVPTGEAATALSAGVRVKADAVVHLLTSHAAKHGPLFIEDVEDLRGAILSALSDAPVVTEEMVEKGCRAQWQAERNGDNQHDAMKAALTAALGGGE